MPSLKMKTNQTNQTTDCLKEKNGIHVCPMSTKISKSSLSRLKIVQNAEDVASIIQTTQSDSCDKECFLETQDGLQNNETVGGDTMKCQMHHEPLTKWTAFSCRMESMPASCPTNSDTIFSPTMESIDTNGDAYLMYFDGDSGLSVPQLEAEDSDGRSNGSLLREYYDCSISDFSISDMIFSAPVLNDLTYDNNTDVRFFPDSKCEEPIASFEMDSEQIPFSYLNNNDAENSFGQDNRICDTVTVSCDSNLYFSFHQSRSCDPESELISSYAETEQADSFDPHMYIKNLADLPDLASDRLPSVQSKDWNTTKCVTLVLDLDETLVHSTLEPSDDADFTFPVFFNAKEHIVYVKQRPHLHVFLNRVADMFDVVIFTASLSIYAKQLLDILDPDGKIISRRAYRESCIFSNGNYTKDLTVLGLDLAKVVIIDNSPQVFRLQVNNGIPIKSWFDDPSDSALLSLLPFLETLADVDDVRPIIAKRFGNPTD